MTITAPSTKAIPAAPPLSEESSHAILVRAARSCEDDAIKALAAARLLGDQGTIRLCAAERDQFGRLLVGLLSRPIASAAA